jgi:hypothetical protein
MTLFKESDKKLSYSRILGSLVILWQVGIQSVIILRTNALVDIMPNWLMLIVGLYGLNKLSDAFKNKGK